MAEPEILTEVPEDLKRLVRIIMRAFYDVEFAIVMDKLIHHPCIKEEELLDLVRFERKQLRAIMTKLKEEKFVRVRMRMETEPDPLTAGATKATRHNYYFISYSVFVNVIKYKLDHIRRKIETEEWDASNRASFSCPECHKQFTDLEVDQLLDLMSGQLLCSYCQTEVVEEAAAKPGSDTRSLMAKFNEEIEPIYSLLRKVEDIRLSNDILEPEPSDFKASKVGSSRMVNGKVSGVWSGDGKKNIGFGATENQVTISFDSRSAAAAASAKPAKEVPQWIAHSTVEGADKLDSPYLPTSSRASSSAAAGGSRDIDSEDIMRTLMHHEKKPGGHSAVNTLLSVANDRLSSSSSDDEMEHAGPQKSFIRQQSAQSAVDEKMEMESEDDDEMIPMVKIGSEQVPLDKVTEEMVARMTPVEKAEYIRLGQAVYNYYD